MRNKAVVKLFLVIVLSTTYLISFSQIGAFAYESIFLKHNRFAEGTMIGSVDVSGLSKKEAINKIVQHVNEWKAVQRMTIAYQERKEAIPADLFAFQIEQSIEQAVDGQKSQLFVGLDEKQLHFLISRVVGENFISLFDIERLKHDIIETAAALKANLGPLEMADYVIKEQGIGQKIISEAVITNLQGNHSEVLAWISKHPTIEIKEKSQFSLANYFKEQSDSLSSEGMSLIASAIYQTVLPTNFTIMERHTSRELPNSIPIGYEAKVDQQNRDFIFYNPNSSSYTLELQALNKGFKVALKGLPFVNKYVIKLDEVEYFEPKTIIQYSPALQPNETRLKQEGKQGMLVKVKKQVYDEQNHLLKTELIAEDFYPPVHKIEIHGLDIGISTESGVTNSENDSMLNNNNGQNEQQKTAPTDDGNESIHQDSTQDSSTDNQGEIYEK
ncbi:surface rod structure-forming protein G [Anoxybacillus vitaminiphilus]|uniref:Surface rod structure-forming protein G n=1 Tax=Paranoxybacillus vitaminiphilus TaxID=581036 RepID=A0A327YMD5_9BACL|nr:VanW family protein [Anoxybacillus vitaminiphilus]RAK21376.1 surface rod structure-forming protein G [Anoxybacillus vitaminiphilus]